MFRYFILSALCIIISGCSPEKSLLASQKDSLTHKAFHYYGLDEEKDRQLIKEIMGVDPVRTEWCAAFVNMVLLENDLPQSSTVSLFPLTARSFLKWGDEVDEPQQGDIIVFKRGEPWQGHVGFYVNSKVLNGQLVYYVLGGNQDNKVSIITYPADRLLSIRRYNPNQAKLDLATVF